jgi:hypothetical protein
VHFELLAVLPTVVLETFHAVGGFHRFPRNVGKLGINAIPASFAGSLRRNVVYALALAAICLTFAVVVPETLLRQGRVR